MQQQGQRMQEQVQEATSSVQSRLREQLDERSTRAGEQVDASAHALRTAGERLREEGQDAPARAAERMAHHTERLAGYLKEADGDRMLHDAEDFGRRRPMAIVGLGALAGFAASRLLKASSRSRYQRWSAGDSPEAAR